MNLSLETVPLPDAELLYAPEFLSPAEADALFSRIHRQIAWERHRIRLFGREIDSPRLSCWVGDPEAVYTYSGTRFAPHPWTADLSALREQLSDLLNTPFNSVLANLYRSGQDSMGWHSDDEPELGPEPVIASLSLGGERAFRLRHRYCPEHVLTLRLANGSLLVMRGNTQRYYRHALPRTARMVGPRINLSFRLVLSTNRVAAGSR